MLKVFGTAINFNGLKAEKISEWTRYDDIGDMVNKAVSPLCNTFTHISASKLKDLDDIIWQNSNVGGIVYFVHKILSKDNKYNEIMLDLILNVIYPKKHAIDAYSIRFLTSFLDHCDEFKFSAQERKIAIERVISGENFKTIKFEKVDDDETLNLVNQVLENVNLDDIRKKPTLVNYYVGQVMKLAKGKAPVSLVKDLISSRL